MIEDPALRHSFKTPLPDCKKRSHQITIGSDCPAPMDDNMDDAPLKKTVDPIAPVQPFPHARNYALAKVVG